MAARERQQTITLFALAGAFGVPMVWGVYQFARSCVQSPSGTIDWNDPTTYDRRRQRGSF